ncbi:collagen alpha-1(VII) chain-like [Pan paniscus]|uniref:collagen alpha-1(VII) chain n=1 Tax=Pan troglodytes TaxID=9598 RepID=UPI000048A0D2|nr:collagen alpha-1(VII) chain [Pan troglodytes]XP_034799718.1 collagen alpha-1(VII) chain-like [Pan paniscus]|eukprot:NP_001276896.1 uncharacterized protein LOC101927322 [Homo sapiens]
MALAGDPGLPGLPPAPSRASAPGHLPLASEPRRQGRKNKSGSAARPSEEEAPLPAPIRQQESSGLHRVRLPPAISVIKAGNPVEDAFPWNDPEWTTPELSLPILATSKAIIPLKTMASFGTKRK